ncbi:hypothetical protein HS1genome_0430 [Sulfodiicoccus acidiphilus]|nr:acyl-CoA dehydrogenase family protein [Sulfodiicoccus acidiphilus]BBD72041.1 hypothetical protein HS1genome_0430 [Sulfodiicoccus acidiphilus]
MGLDFLTLNNVELNGVEVEKTETVGEIGNAWRSLIGAFNVDRLALAGMLVGSGRRALWLAVQHAKERRTFGRVLGSNQAIQFPLARAHVKLDAAEALVFRSLNEGDPGSIEFGLAAIESLYQSVEASSEAVDVALQTLGGQGYVEGPIEMLYRDVRYYKLGPISEEMSLSAIAERTLGLPRSF